jgi:hypothetical protein
MKNTTRSNVYLSIAAVILTATLAVSAVAQLQQVPFKGTFQGNATVTAPTLIQSSTGIGTLVGQFSSTTVLTLPGRTGSAHWIAANGDSIDTTVVGSVEPVDVAPCQVAGAQPEDTYAKITQVQTISGGTGRFAGTQGSFSLTLYHDLILRNGTHGTCGSFSGTITPPDATH